MDISNNHIDEKHVDKINEYLFSNKTLFEIRIEGNSMMKDCDGFVKQPLSKLYELTKICNYTTQKKLGSY